MEELMNLLRNAGLRFSLPPPKGAGESVEPTKIHAAPIPLVEAAGMQKGKLKKLVREGKLRTGLFSIKGNAGAVRMYYMTDEELGIVAQEGEPS